MANQSPDRRRVLEMLAKAAAVSRFPGFVRWAYADQSDAHASHAPKTGAVYKPQFFHTAEYEAVDRVTELIIPKDESPGAHEAGVVEFIDFMAAQDSEIQQPFRDGLSWLEHAAQTKFGSAFELLPEARQIELLQNAAADQAGPGGKFFRLIREYTLMGYYTSLVGLKELDYPGLKLYSHSPACPHKDDPEHKHLSVGKV